ncbi:MAG: hypothetical protein ACE5I3_02565 [Phycisphaerae bacterium]
MNDRRHLLNEKPNPHAGEIDGSRLDQDFAVRRTEDCRIPGAVAACPQLSAAIYLTAPLLRAGRRLIYVRGAPATGRAATTGSFAAPGAVRSSP